MKEEKELKYSDLKELKKGTASVLATKDRFILYFFMWLIGTGLTSLMLLLSSKLSVKGLNYSWVNGNVLFGNSVILVFISIFSLMLAYAYELKLFSITKNDFELAMKEAD